MTFIDIVLHHTGMNAAAAHISQPTERALGVIAFVSMLIATVFHEFGHAWMADRLGDPTPREQKRVTLNPMAHLDPLGLLLMIATSLIGFPIGWGGKPVRTNPENFRIGAKKGMGLVAFAGPAMNLLLATALAPIARWILWGGMGESDFALACLFSVFILMLINISLATFNLIVPIAPLDGCHVVASLLPEPLSTSFRVFMGRFGSYILIALMVSDTKTHFLTNVMFPIIIRIFFFLIGMGA